MREFSACCCASITPCSAVPEHCMIFDEVSSKLEADAKFHPKMEPLMPPCHRFSSTPWESHFIVLLGKHQIGSQSDHHSSTLQSSYCQWAEESCCWHSTDLPTFYRTRLCHFWGVTLCFHLRSSRENRLWESLVQFPAQLEAVQISHHWRAVGTAAFQTHSGSFTDLLLISRKRPQNSPGRTCPLAEGLGYYWGREERTCVQGAT